MIKDYVNYIKSYPHDENLNLFKRDLLKMIHQASVNEQSSRFTKLLRRSLDGDKDLLVKIILELTINDDRKLI